MCDPITASILISSSQYLLSSNSIGKQGNAVRKQTAFNIAGINKQYDKLKSQQNVNYAVSGVETSGSVEEVLVQTEEDREFDKLTEVYKGDLKLAELKRKKKQALIGSISTGLSVYGNLNSGAGASKTIPVDDQSWGYGTGKGLLK